MHPLPASLLGGLNLFLARLLDALFCVLERETERQRCYLSGVGGIPGRQCSRETGGLVLLLRLTDRARNELTRGPLPPTLAASSFLAFSSVLVVVSADWGRKDDFDGREDVRGGPYRHAASPGRPCPRRPSRPWPSSWPPALCRCLVSHGCGAVVRGSWSVWRLRTLRGLALPPVSSLLVEIL